jgi:hypothetical protein
MNKQTENELKIICEAKRYNSDIPHGLRFFKIAGQVPFTGPVE